MVKRDIWRTFVISLIILVFSFSAYAVESTSSTGGNLVSSSSTDSNADKAYKCLENQIANKSTLSFQEAVFGMLALGSKGKLKENIESQKSSREACWPKEGCKIKETAQVALAYNRAGISTIEIVNWLKSKLGTPSEMSWFLEIDTVNHNPASCTIKYDGKEFRTSINEDMKLTSSAGSCLVLSSNEFWLRITSDCLDKSFEVSCDQDFVTALIYQKSGGDTVYVSSKTQSAASLGTTTEKVNSQCFKIGDTCDYEGSLWAALTLQKLGEDVSNVLPYIVALSDENQKYFASAFAYALTSDAEYYDQIIQLRKQNQYWEVSGNLYNRFYDTSLGMLALGSSSSGSSELSRTKEYLAGIQTKEGCWNNNNIRDTAFILYSGWPKNVVRDPGASRSVSCVEAGFSCERLSECISAGGEKKDGYDCPSGASICCSVKVQKKTCREENGNICKKDESCDGATFEAGDGSCCLGRCIPNETPAPQKSECEEAEGTCKTSCESGEKESSEKCEPETNVCCVKKSSSGWGGIIFLAVLIILVILGIVFREKIKIWWFARKKAKSSPVTKTIPPSTTPSTFRYGGMSPAPIKNRPGPFVPPKAPPSAPTTKDKEMEETLRKLREMAK